MAMRLWGSNQFSTVAIVIASRTSYRPPVGIIAGNANVVVGVLLEIGNKGGVADKGDKTGVGGQAIAPSDKVMVDKGCG